MTIEDQFRTEHDGTVDLQLELKGARPRVELTLDRFEPTTSGAPAMSGTERGEGVLYEVTWNGQDDYLPDAALDTIERVVLSRLPATGFDVKSIQARASSVTATVAFDGIADAFSQERAMDAMLRATTVIRTLHANLVACRSTLAAAIHRKGWEEDE
jgi:hypothetical protein